MPPNKLDLRTIGAASCSGVAEVVKTFEIWVQDQDIRGPSVIVRILRDFEQRKMFYPVVLRHVECRVKPSFVETVANEEVLVVDRAFGRERFKRMSAEAALEAAMHTVRSMFKVADTSKGSNLCAGELMRTVEIGPYDCPGEAPWHFVVKIYRSVGKKTFFPVVCRREFYRMKGRWARTLTDEQFDIPEHSFEPERFNRTSERATAAAILGHIRRKFEPKRPRRRRA